MEASKLMRLYAFVQESNKIEGIYREPTDKEIEITDWFLNVRPLTVECIEQLVEVYAPGAKLRERPRMDVVVGMYRPPRGGPDIRVRLNDILDANWSPYLTHIAYEKLHPFIDGNGRSGRAIWLRQMGGHAPLGFLHTFYYQTLGAA